MVIITRTILITVISVIFHSKPFLSAQQLEEQKVQSHEPCNLDRDCKENAFCYGNDDEQNGYCKCQKKFTLIQENGSYECFAGVKLGDACEKDIQCQLFGREFAICNQYKICECNSESQNVEGKCYKKAKINETCLTDANCPIINGTTKDDGTSAYCVNGYCQCSGNTKSSEDKTRCFPTKNLGESCNNDNECSLATPNSKCFEKCECATEYTESRDGTSCVKAATKFDDPCEFDGQCSKFLAKSICSNNKCGCENNLHGYGIRCVETKKPGDQCLDDAQCVYQKELTGNVKCQGTCTCLLGQKSDGSCIFDQSSDDNNSTTKLILNLFLFFISTIVLLVK